MVVSPIGRQWPGAGSRAEARLCFPPCPGGASVLEDSLREAPGRDLALSLLGYWPERIISTWSAETGQPPPGEAKPRRGAWVHSGPEQLLGTQSVTCCTLVLGVPLCLHPGIHLPQGQGWGKARARPGSSASTSLPEAQASQ